MVRISATTSALEQTGGEFICQSGYPCMRLWPETVANLGIDEADTDPLFRLIEKRLIHLNTTNSKDWRFQETSMPLSGIIILEPRDPELTAPKIKRLDAVHSLPILMAQRAAGQCLLGKEYDQYELTQMVKLTSTIPSWSVANPDDISCLDQTVALIVDTIDKSSI